MGQRRVASPVTATTDLLAADILDKYGRAVPPVPHALRRTRTTILRTVTVNGERQCDASP